MDKLDDKSRAEIVFVGSTLGPLFLHDPEHDAQVVATGLEALASLDVEAAAKDWPFVSAEDAERALALMHEGLAEGTKLKKTVLEFCYKDDALGDPMVNEYHILAMGFCTKEELDTIASYALKVNEILSEYLKEVNIELIDFKLEFGKTADGTIVLADEISPDTSRFWDSATHEPLDIDRFRRDLGNVEQAYQEVLHRMMGMDE